MEFSDTFPFVAWPWIMEASGRKIKVEAATTTGTTQIPASFLICCNTPKNCSLLQDLLCVLIDDGGFLVLSNQDESWKQVRCSFSIGIWLVQPETSFYKIFNVTEVKSYFQAAYVFPICMMHFIYFTLLLSEAVCLGLFYTPETHSVNARRWERGGAHNAAYLQKNHSMQLGNRDRLATGSHKHSYVPMPFTNLLAAYGPELCCKAPDCPPLHRFSECVQGRHLHIQIQDLPQHTLGSDDFIY